MGITYVRGYIPHAIIKFMTKEDLRPTLKALKEAGYKVEKNSTWKGTTFMVTNPHENDQTVFTANIDQKSTRYMIKYHPSLYPPQPKARKHADHQT